MTDQPRAVGFSTLAIHAGTRHGGGGPTAIDRTADFIGHDDGSVPRFDALGGPCASKAVPIALLEERVAALEGGSAALALASGRAARLLALQALLRPGDEFIAARRRPGGPNDRTDHAFASFGWVVRWADPARPDAFVDALTEKTKAIVCESIADPDGTIVDLESVATLARRARLPLIVDNTLATPYLVRPIEQGADVVLHAAGKFLGGPGTTAGGLIVDGGSFDWAGDDRYPALSRPAPGHGGLVIGETYGNFAFVTACRVLGLRDLGPTLSPADAATILSGIETLPLRMRQHCENALAVARALQGHAAVASVRYAGLPDDPGHALASRRCPKGVGAILGFALKGGADACFDLVRRLKLIARGAGTGGARSLVLHPASRSNGAAGRYAQGGPGDLLRLSVGLEDADDIIADLYQALGG